MPLSKKSRKVLMMMKAAKLGLTRSRAGAGQEQGRNRAGAELSSVKQSRAERGQEPVRNWVRGSVRPSVANAFFF